MRLGVSNMKAKDNPCFGCVEPKRHVGCHATCSDGKTYRKKLDEENEKIRKQKDIANDFKVYQEFAHYRLKNWDKKKGK